MQPLVYKQQDKCQMTWKIFCSNFFHYYWWVQYIFVRIIVLWYNRMSKKYLIVAHGSQQYRLACQDLKKIIYKAREQLPKLPLYHESPLHRRPSIDQNPTD